MKRLTRSTLLLLFLGLLASPALAGGNANFILGSRGLDKDFWEPVESQTAFGATVDFGKDGWPVQLAIGVHASAAEEDENVPFFGTVTLTGAVSELSFGVLKEWKLSGNAHPYVGGGLAFVTAAAEFSWGPLSVDDNDSSGAFYAHGGVFWRLGRRFNIGLDARALIGSDISFDFGASGVPIVVAEGDADYLQLGLLLGWGWPPSK